MVQQEKLCTDTYLMAFAGGAVAKNLPASGGNARGEGLIPGLGRSPGEGNDNPLQYSCLENPMDRRTCRTAVHRVTQSQTRLKWLSTHPHMTLTRTHFLLVTHMVVEQKPKSRVSDAFLWEAALG